MKKITRKFISEEQLGKLVDSIPHGKFFSLYFARVAPKCLKCGKKSELWTITRQKRCECGGTISYDREAIAQTGVFNPSDPSIAPKGIGESFEEKRKKGLFGFYDSQLKQYRTCRLSHVIRIATNGTEYFVVH